MTLAPGPRTTKPHSNGRICFVANHSAAGGVGELWADLVEALGEVGYQANLVAFWPLQSGPTAATGKNGWQHVVEQKPRSVYAFTRFLFALADYFRQTDPDWIVTAMPAANVLAPLVAGISDGGIKVITTHHTPASSSAGLFAWLDRYVKMTPNVQFDVYVSKSVAATYPTRWSWTAAKQRVIHNALPPHIERLLDALKLKKESSTTFANHTHVVALGRLAVEKNFEVLIRAAKLMPGIKVSIIGGGPEHDRLRNLTVANGVADRVKMLGFMPREDALNIFASGDFFVQMSRVEGHSLALLEAAKLGLPLIVSNVPAQVEGVTDAQGNVCGVVIDVDDEKGLADAINRLAHDQELYAQMSRKALKIAELTSFDDTVAKYSSLLVNACWG